MPAEVQHIQATVLQSHISAARFQPYLDCTTSPTAALALYRWNVVMSGAIHESLALVEVFLRNAIDRELQLWNSVRSAPAGAVPHTYEWVKNPAAPLHGILNPRGRGGVRKSTYESAKFVARQDADLRDPAHPRHRMAVVHDDIVAHITFGTWNNLLPHGDKKHASGIGPGPQRGMWENSLRHAFPDQPDPLVIKYWVNRLHRIRNRIAHLEPLIATDVMSYHRTASRLLRAIDPDVGSWYAGVSRVPETFRKRP